MRSTDDIDTSTTATDAVSEDGHGHGPQPSYEWVIEGDQAMVVPHLTAIAPTLQWEDEHFHVNDVDPVDDGMPALKQIALGDEPIGALDFLPLPQKRCLMRLFLCSDIGTACSLEHGNDVMQGFATAWIRRLGKLGFMTVAATGERENRPLGFPMPTEDDPDEDEAAGDAPAPDEAAPSGPAGANDLTSR